MRQQSESMHSPQLQQRINLLHASMLHRSGWRWSRWSMMVTAATLLAMLVGASWLHHLWV